MTPKLFIAAVAVIAIAVGFVLPSHRAGQDQARSQVQLQEVGVS